MSPNLIVVSNREPYLIRRTAQGQVVTQPSPGGLVSALDPAVRALGGVWISWSGFERELPRDGEPLPERIRVPEEPCVQYTLRRIPLTEREASLYYYGFANRTLWPLCHQFGGRVEYDAETFRAYRRVNQRFADAVLEELGDTDAPVWIHDYHLALVPALVRAARPSARIAFSWHIPWPPEDTWRALPWAEEIVAGLLGADCLSFHLERYRRNFLGCVAGSGGVATDESARVAVRGRTCDVLAATMGPDVGSWEAMAQALPVAKAVRLRRNLGAEKLILAVDRLDFTKGILERLEAVEHFFDRYPSHRGRAVFCQIAVPSRTRVEEYREMKRQVDDLVARINGRFGTGAWQPIRYFYRNFEPAELAAYYVAAHVALVTPLRDGLPLTALEYVASRVRDDGVLVLSELAGAADLLPGALLVNPNNPDRVVQMLRSALEMEPEEARRTMSGLRERVRALDVEHWRRRICERAFGRPLGGFARDVAPAVTEAALGA